MIHGYGQFWTAVTFSGSVEIPSSSTTWTKYSTLREKRTHFSFSIWNQLRKCDQALSTSFQSITSSRYIRQISHCRPAFTVSINLWIVAGAQLNPNGRLRNRNIHLRVIKAVFRRSSFSIKTCCKYPEQRSSVENHAMPKKIIQWFFNMRQWVKHPTDKWTNSFSCNSWVTHDNSETECHG